MRGPCSICTTKAGNRTGSRAREAALARSRERATEKVQRVMRAAAGPRGEGPGGVAGSESVCRAGTGPCSLGASQSAERAQGPVVWERVSLQSGHSAQSHSLSQCHWQCHSGSSWANENLLAVSKNVTQLCLKYLVFLPTRFVDPQTSAWSYSMSTVR